MGRYISKTVREKELFCGLVKTKYAEYLKGVDFLGNNGYALIPPSRIDDLVYAPFTTYPIREISKQEYSKIKQFFLLEKPIQMRKPFRDILNGEIEIEEYATKHNKDEFIYWKSLFREAYHFCKLTPEEIFPFLKRNQPTFSIEKTNYQLNYHYHSYKGKVLSNKKLKDYFPDYYSNYNHSYSNSVQNNNNIKSTNFTLSGLESYLSEFLSNYTYNNQFFDNHIVSKIRIKLINLLSHVDKLHAREGDCDSCATFTEVKTVSFKDPEGKLLTINECKECFESDWNMDWDCYIEDFIIFQQKS